jgi:hypothetical protein
MDWINYRWAEGAAVINNHPDRIERFFYEVQCISKRLADFCIFRTL